VTNFELVLRLFLQLTVVLGTCRAVSFVLKRLGQTSVVGEMVAGMLLGPSLLGLVAPAAEAWLFPKAPLILATGASVPNPSMSILGAISQVGLVLYMFLVGAELDLGLLRERARGAALVSLSGIAAPFALGAAASFFVRERDGTLFADGVDGTTAALYLGAAMSITAFPMLARILFERGLAKSRLGVLTLAAGATDDVIAWCMLAAVLSWTKHDARIAALAIGGAIGFAFVAHAIVGRFVLAPLARRAERTGASPATIAIVLVLLFFSAFVTDAVGVHAVFGAFVLGTALPRGVLSRDLFEKLEPLTTAVLVPMFFANAGLNASLGLLGSGSRWALTGVLALVAVVGKLGACSVAARATGESWRDALTVGTLMNTRGMMGLIILTIGLEQRVLSPALYSMLFFVALVTTLATSPIVARLTGPAARAVEGSVRRSAP
jgi:Kef-type K+ transport system membrane component KefB